MRNAVLTMSTKDCPSTVCETCHCNMLRKESMCISVLEFNWKGVSRSQNPILLFKATSGLAGGF